MILDLIETCRDNWSSPNETPARLIMAGEPSSELLAAWPTRDVGLKSFHRKTSTLTMGLDHLHFYLGTIVACSATGVVPLPCCVYLLSDQGISEGRSLEYSSSRSHHGSPHHTVQVSLCKCNVSRMKVL